MKRFAIMLSTAAMISLGGCATTGGTNQTTITQIQQITVALCGFLPTAAVIADIITMGNPLVATGNAIADAICKAVLPAKMARAAGRKRANVPMVGDVVIHGRFIR